MDSETTTPSADASQGQSPPTDVDVPKPRPWYSPDPDVLIARLVAAAFFLSILLLYPYSEVYEFDPDEGNRLMIAKLVSEGHALYGEIWNDQPPLMTFVLRAWCGIFGWDVNAARVLTLILASVMAFAGYDAIRTAFSVSGRFSSRVAGHVGGLVWVLLLPLVDTFLRLSVSAMVGLPSIAFAVLAVWAFVHWTVSNRQSWLIASGVLMGCSLMIKAFTGFLLPILGVAILITATLCLRKGDPLWKVLPAPAIWSVAVIGFCAALLLAVVPIGDFSQLVAPHLKGTDVDIGGADDASLVRLASYVGQAKWLFWLAGIGVVAVAVQRKWSLLVVAAWCVVGYVGLRNHAPIWYHHAVLITIPAALMAGALFAAVIDGLWPFRLRVETLVSAVTGISGVVVLVLLLVQFAGRPHPTFGEMRQAESARHRYFTALIDEVQKLNPGNTVIVTDRQMYALNAGVSIPPNHGLTTSKRVDTGNLTADEFISEIETYQPNQVVLVRAVLKALGNEIGRAIANDYEPLIMIPRQAAVYVRRSIMPEDRLALLTAAAEAEPESGFAWVLIGQERLKRGDGPAAMYAYERALSGDLDPRTYLQLAQQYIQQRAFSQDPTIRNPAKAEPVLQRMLELSGGRMPHSYYELAAAVAAAQGNRASAIERLRIALQLAQQAGDQIAIQRINTSLQRFQQ
jgi:hypothetical protein